MTTYDFLMRNWPELMALAWQHTVFVGIALVIAIATGVPLGIYLTFNRRLADTVLYLAGIMMTVAGALRSLESGGGAPKKPPGTF